MTVSYTKLVYGKTGRRCWYNNNKARSRNHCCRGQAVLHIMSACVCSLNYPACKAHAPYYIVICGLSVSTMFLHIISHTTRFSEKMLLNIKCGFWFSVRLLPETFLVLRTERDIIINVHRSSCKVPLILVKFEWNLNFLNRFSKNTQISNVMKIISVGPVLSHVDGRTDMAKLMVAFRNFAYAPKNGRTDGQTRSLQPHSAKKKQNHISDTCDVTRLFLHHNHSPAG
jgi:hypothetical protein